jgi:hypothetical protein
VEDHSGWRSKRQTLEMPWVTRSVFDAVFRNENDIGVFRSFQCSILCNPFRMDRMTAFIQ